MHISLHVDATRPPRLVAAGVLYAHIGYKLSFYMFNINC